jgi:hypothetical protein
VSIPQEAFIAALRMGEEQITTVVKLQKPNATNANNHM